MESHQHSFYIYRLQCEYIPKHSSSFLLALHMNDDYLECVGYATLFTTVDVSHATTYSCRHGENKTYSRYFGCTEDIHQQTEYFTICAIDYAVRRIDVYLHTALLPCRASGLVQANATYHLDDKPRRRNPSSLRIPNARTQTKRIGITSSAETFPLLFVYHRCAGMMNE